MTSATNALVGRKTSHGINYGVRTWLAERLASLPDRPLLRIAVSPGATEIVEYSGPQILAASRQLVEDLRLPERSRPVLLLLPHSPELFLLHIGLVLAGHVPAILPWPTTRVDPEKYRRNLLYQLANLPADHLITLPAVADSLGASIRQRISTCAVRSSSRFEHDLEKLSAPADQPSALPSAPALPDDVMFLQFSGGTTGVQKCVAITETMLAEQLQRLAGALKLDDSDGVVSWLPLYHDMGLIANLWLPLWAQIPSTHVAASDWILRPELLLQMLERYKATLCWLPNFAFAYLARQRPRMEAQYSLGHVRAWINCSEPVRQPSITSFTETFHDWGVRPDALQASYAMAENVFAITQTTMSGAPRFINAHTSSGPCLPGMQLRVVRADGTACEEKESGEIQIATPCLFGGYWSASGVVRHAFTSDGWYATGDLGFIDASELFVVGRLKDLIIVGGQNVFPEDVESLAAGAPGIHPGRIVAFAIDEEGLGTQSIAIVAEVSGDFDADAAAGIEIEIRALVTAGVGIAPRYVSAVPRQWIVKSTAGKISRHDTRSRFMQEFLA